MARRQTVYHQRQQQQRGPELDLHQVILRPIVSEKSLQLAEQLNQYTFEVNRWATKQQVRRAVEQLFDVRVVAVRIVNLKGKRRRMRFTEGRTAAKKKAIVRLHPDDRLNFV